MGKHNSKIEKNTIIKRVKSESKTERTKNLFENNNNFNLQLDITIMAHNDWVYSVRQFPSGNLISISSDQSIKIFNGFNYNLIQHIQKAHESRIYGISIKDDNNFITSSSDQTINIWKKKDKNFELMNYIVKAHTKTINNVIYLSNYNIISCSDDYKIKIWKLNNTQYKLLSTSEHSQDVNSLLLLEDKNILISGGNDGTKFWNLYENKSLSFICHFKAIDNSYNGISRIDNDRIIIGGLDSLEIISINKRKIINSIKIPFRCNAITVMEEKGLFFVGGWSKDIKIYRCDNYNCIKTIQKAHDDYITDFNKLKDDLILSCSGDCTIKIWSFN